MTLKRKNFTLLSLIISFLIITTLVVQKNIFITNIDNVVAIFINTIRSPILNEVALAITKVGNMYQSFSIFIMFGIILITQKRKISFYILLIATALGAALPEIIKSITERIRPVSNLLTETNYSFPSGHATISFVFLFTTIFLIAPLIKNHVLKISFILISSIVFPLVALSRIYLSVHWTSDVLAGILLGCICYLSAQISLRKSI